MAALTQRQINESMDWAVANLTGKVRDEFGGFEGECLSLNRREFIHRAGLATAPNSPTGVGTGWMQRPGALKDFFNDVEPYNPHIDYPRGSYAFNAPTNHIMIYDHREGGMAAVLEQNADPEHSPAGIKLREGSRISHIMTPKIAPEVPYIRSDIPDKTIQFNKDAARWDLNRYDFNDRAAHPIETKPGQTLAVVREIVHFTDTNSYYVENPGDTTGFNVKDCDDYTPPAPAAPVEPDWKYIYTFERFENPLNVRVKQNMALWNLKFEGGFANAQANAMLSQTNAEGEIEWTDFTAVGKATKQDFDAHPVYYMSDEAFGDADKTGEPAFWQGVNTTDLQPAPVDVVSTPVIEEKPEAATPVELVEPDDSEKIEVKVNPPANPDSWKTSFKTNEAGDYQVLQTVTVTDLEGKLPDIILPKGAKSKGEDCLKVAGKFIKDGVEYWRSEKSASRVDPATLTPKEEDWRGIPVTDGNGNDVLEEDLSFIGYIDSKLDNFEDAIHHDGVAIRKKIAKAGGEIHGEVESLVSRFKIRRSK